MTMLLLSALTLLFALIPAIVYARNVRFYRVPPGPRNPILSVSILIPARNESRSIGPCVEAALLTEGIAFEIIVLDDHSEDDTAEIVGKIVDRDSRVRQETAPPLPAGWCGKQHACFALAKLAKHPILCFLDADVRVAPDGIARMAGFLQESGADLVSGFPRQETETFLERLLIPLIHFVLLGFLPIWRMRRSKRASFGAGCGQMFVIKREAYEKTGGHETVKASLHDGITLPRAFRQQGFATDLCDATPLASCRMYRSGREVWSGLAKNAREGMASFKMIVPITAMLLFGQVLPIALTLYLFARFLSATNLPGADFQFLTTWFEESGFGAALAMSSIATIAMYYPRFDAVRRFRQSMESAFLHPLGIVMLLAIQWYALIRSIFRRGNTWKGRVYPG